MLNRSRRARRGGRNPNTPDRAPAQARRLPVRGRESGQRGGHTRTFRSGRGRFPLGLEAEAQAPNNSTQLDTTLEDRIAVEFQEIRAEFRQQIRQEVRQAVAELLKDQMEPFSPPTHIPSSAMNVEVQQLPQWEQGGTSSKRTKDQKERCSTCKKRHSGTCQKKPVELALPVVNWGIRPRSAYKDRMKMWQGIV